MDSVTSHSRGRHRGQRSVSQTQNRQIPLSQLPYIIRTQQQNVPRLQVQSQNIRPILSEKEPQSSLQVSGNQDKIFSQVESIMTSIINLAADDIHTSVGQAAVCERSEIKHNTSRPESSQVTKSGTLGNSIVLKNYYFPIIPYPNNDFYQYRIDFNPPEDRISVQRQLLNTHKNNLGTYICDGTMLFSVKKYEFKKFELVSKRSSDDQIIIITVSFCRLIDKNDKCAVQLFNLVVRNFIKQLYGPLARIEINYHNIQIWLGYDIAIRIFDVWQLLRSEITTKIKRQETVLHFLEECVCTGFNKKNMDEFKSRVIGSIVATNYNNKINRIDDVTDVININSTFKLNDGTRISYTDYYQKKYGIIPSGNQPLLLFKKNKTFNFIHSDEEQLIFLIPEFCILTDLSETVSQKMYLMKNVGEYTNNEPKQRIIKYNSFMNRLQNTPKSIEEFKNWNLTLDKDLIDVTDRVLSLQRLNGNDKNRPYAYGPNGCWANSVRSLPMLTHFFKSKWVLLCPKTVSHCISSFVSNLQFVASEMKFELPPPEIVIMNRCNASDYSRDLEKIINQRNPHLILVVIPYAHLYKTIKWKLCVNRAVPSQVVLSKHLIKINKLTNIQIAKVIKCKLGSTLWHVRLPQNMMTIGIDSYHDRQNENISYDAFVASLNFDCTQFFSGVQKQRNGEELSNQIDINIIKALQKYRNINNMLPEKIIVYRKSVDGQLQYIYKNELEQLKSACVCIYGLVPPLAFIIVEKQIPSEFYLPKISNHFDNPPPGTETDSQVTNLTLYRFYLVSRDVQYKPVTPTHYNVIEDTLNNWSPNKMQKLTLELTNFYDNYTGIIRIPSICQLAYKLASFTAHVIGTTPNPGLDEILYYL